MLPGTPLSAIILLCLLTSAVSVNAQALTPAQIRTRIQEVNDKRRALRQEFATLMQQYRDTSPQERQRILGSWQTANAGKLHSLDEQQKALQKSRAAQSPKMIPPTRKAPGSLSIKEKEQWELREALNRSKMAELARVKDFPPQARQQAMTAWQRQNAPQLAKLEEVNKAIATERNVQQVDRSTGPREITIPAMPSYLPDSRQSDWDQLWILRHEKAELFKQHRDSFPEVRQSAMEIWANTRGRQLNVLEAQLSSLRN